MDEADAALAKALAENAGAFLRGGGVDGFAFFDQGAHPISLAACHEVATDAVGTLVAPDAAGQAEAVFDRIEAVLRAAGGDLGDLVSLSVFLLEPHDFGAVSAVRDARLREPPPASTLVYVSGFVEMGVRVEISGLAMIDGAGARG